MKTTEIQETHVDNELYNEHAELYTVIADDRNFEDEVTRMRVFDKLSPDATFVELFAGPAYHSRALANLGWKGNIIATDRSAAMQSIAYDKGFAGEYLCMDALDGLLSIKNADLICVPRYSIMLVDNNYVGDLFYSAAQALRAGGFLFIELFKDPVVDNNSRQPYKWDNLSIHRREKKISGATIECIWPFTIEFADPSQQILELKVKVSVLEDSGGKKELIFSSREYFHPISKLDEHAANAGFCRFSERDFTTRDGAWVAYRKVEMGSRLEKLADLNPQLTEEHLQTMTEDAFGRIFDLSSVEACEKLIKKSGLNVDLHDAPLSLHIYTMV